MTSQKCQSCRLALICLGDLLDPLPKAFKNRGHAPYALLRCSGCKQYALIRHGDRFLIPFGGFTPACEVKYYNRLCIRCGGFSAGFV